MNDNHGRVGPSQRSSRLRIALGQRLKERRQTQGISIGDAARAIGTASADLEAIECGQRAINPQELLRLCRLLQVDISWPFDASSQQLSGFEVQEPGSRQQKFPMAQVTELRKDASEA